MHTIFYIIKTRRLQYFLQSYIIEKKRKGTYKINVRCVVHAFEHRKLIAFQLQCTTQMKQTCLYLFLFSKQLQEDHDVQHQHHIFFLVIFDEGDGFGFMVDTYLSYIVRCYSNNLVRSPVSLPCKWTELLNLTEDFQLLPYASQNHLLLWNLWFY